MKIKAHVAVLAVCLLTLGAEALRPPAVPLVSVSPHFSLWSRADRLYDVDTTHWAGAVQPLSVFLDADGITYRLCGRGDGRGVEMPVLPQESCRVGATTTSYRFADGKGLSAEIDFTTPRLTDDLDVFSRPVTYMTVRVAGAKEATVRATIAGALGRRMDRRSAADFSFLLSVPAILGALILELYKLVKTPAAVAGGSVFEFGATLILGMLAAAISGYFAVRFMIRLVTKKGLFGFAVYTAVLGVAVLILQLTKTLGFGFTPFGG